MFVYVCYHKIHEYDDHKCDNQSDSKNIMTHGLAI